ncbi:MAG: carboxypeptidase-like regulatory domain-containing protein, partial [Bacteroidales bacterium]|nr:carboxypeptidase-like regulatory domain-containing protein [Bacteroidales bacterium]
MVTAVSLSAQEKEKKLSFSLNQQRLDSLISILEEKTAYKFSFNPQSIPVDSIITVEYREKTLGYILDDMGKYGISHTIMAEHIILKKTKRIITVGQREEKKLKYTLSGYITDAQSGEALIGATINDTETGKGAMTNGYAYFSLTLEEGEYLFTSSFLGYKKDTGTIVLNADKYVEIKLEQGFNRLEEIIVVSDDNIDYSPEGGTGVFYLDPSDVTNIQGFLGQSDVIKSLQTMPGINFYGDGSTIFYVRGGARDQNM